MGSSIGLCVVIQVITGLLLTLHYTPTDPFDSVEYIMREVNFGWLIRYIHANTASFIFITLYIHILRNILYGSFRKQRTYYTGIILFLIMIITAFCGYCLVWGNMSLWGATVITSMLTAIPIYGINIVEFIWGGYSVSDVTCPFVDW